MKISEGKHVVLDYQLFINNVNGELVEETADNAPFVFIFKHEPMLSVFEDALEGLEPGNTFSVSIACEDAYGTEREDLFVEVPKETFITDEGIDEEIIAEGEIVPMNDEEGNEFLGVILENKTDSVIIDLNHPLAGENIHFEGSVIEVSDPKSN